VRWLRLSVLSVSVLIFVGLGIHVSLVRHARIV